MNNVMHQEWFVVGQPWIHSNQVPYIIAGSQDPHGGTFVCDLESCGGDIVDISEAYAIGEHICKLQRAYLRARAKRQSA